MHEEKFELAGEWIKIKKKVRHFQYSDFGGSEIRIEDWQDRIVGRSWMECRGNPACIVYEMRISQNSPKLLLDTVEVLYGHRKDGLGSLVHISELEV